MFVLLLMSLALLPMLINATRLGTENRSIISAAALANELVTDARREGESGCSALTAWAARSDLAPSTSGFTAVATATCPAERPGGGRVSVTIHPAGDASRTLSELTTKVLVNP